MRYIWLGYSLLLLVLSAINIFYLVNKFTIYIIRFDGYTFAWLLTLTVITDIFVLISYSLSGVQGSRNTWKLYLLWKILLFCLFFIFDYGGYGVGFHMGYFALLFFAELPIVYLLYSVYLKSFEYNPLSIIGKLAFGVLVIVSIVSSIFIMPDQLSYVTLDLQGSKFSRAIINTSPKEGYSDEEKQTFIHEKEENGVLGGFTITFNPNWSVSNDSDPERNAKTVVLSRGRSRLIISRGFNEKISCLFSDTLSTRPDYKKDSYEYLTKLLATSINNREVRFGINKVSSEGIEFVICEKREMFATGQSTYRKDLFDESIGVIRGVIAEDELFTIFEMIEMLNSLNIS